MRPTSSRASVVDEFSNIKIEVIAADRAVAEKIVDQVAETLFQSYSGIAYLEPVEIWRPGKF